MWIRRCQSRCLSSMRIARRPDLAAVSDEHIRSLSRLCPNNSRDEVFLAVANIDWLGKYKGHSPLILYPSSTHEVAAALRYCSGKRLGVVVQGGNTSLVGGATPVHDEIVLDMRRMNNIIEIDQEQQVLICDAGCILQQLDQKLETVGLTMPLDLGAKGSCQIGGNVATNAGGIRLVRYGSLHANVIGLEWVMANGTVFNNITTLRKDNTGFDLKQLMIGSEGSLGIITKVALLVPRKPTTINLSYLALESFDKVIEALHCARFHLGEILSAIEFQDRQSLEFVLANHPGSQDPMDKSYPFYMIVEASGFRQEHDADRMSRFLEDALDRQIIADGTLAQDSTQIAGLWALRESVAESVGKSGSVFKYDLSLPVKDMYTMVEAMRTRLAPVISPDLICGYGHVGDSNLHLNIVSPEFSDKVQDLTEPFVYDLTRKMGGSISAEHGLGLMKAPYISYSKSEAQIRLMQQVKDLFDPNGILNPYKVLPVAPKPEPAQSIIYQGKP